jgi:hypothetical protein
MNSDISLPVAFLYLRTKADIYLRRGPDRYREIDAFDMPPKDTSPEMLVVLKHAMEQLSQNIGGTPDEPLSGLGIEGFYLLMTTLHFDLASQRIHQKTTDSILDEMIMAHRMTGQTIRLFNKVLSPLLADKSHE